MSVEIGGHEFDLSLCVMEDATVDFILGIDFMIRNRVTLEMRHGVFRLHDIDGRGTAGATMATTPFLDREAVLAEMRAQKHPDYFAELRAACLPHMAYVRMCSRPHVLVQTECLRDNNQ